MSEIPAILCINISGETAISSIIIDGYNLIGIQHRDLRKQREGLILQLIAYRKLKGHDITVVFDGWKSGSRHQEQTVTGGVRIMYSRLGDKADAVIKSMIGQDRQDWIVITSDREIMDHAWRSGSVPVPSDMFLGRLEKCLSLSHTSPFPLFGKEEVPDRAGALIDDEDDYYELTHKGNSRQLSKKEKALMRVLRKL